MVLRIRSTENDPSVRKTVTFTTHVYWANFMVK